MTSVTSATPTSPEVLGILHDMRSSLAAASGFVQCLREEPLTTEGKELLERVQRNLEKMDARLTALETEWRG